MPGVAEMHVGKPPENTREAFEHLLTAYVALAGGLRSGARLEDAVLCHESHEEVDVVAIPAFRERFQVLNGHRHRVLHWHATVAPGQLRVKRGTRHSIRDLRYR